MPPRAICLPITKPVGAGLEQRLSFGQQLAGQMSVPNRPAATTCAAGVLASAAPAVRLQQGAARVMHMLACRLHSTLRLIRHLSTECQVLATS